MKLNEAAASEKTGIAIKTLQNWRASNKGPPFYRLGGRVLYDEQDLKDWMSQCRVVPGQKQAAHA